MPQLIPDVDDYFEKNRKDLYLLTIKNKKAEKRILEWFKTNLPNIDVQKIFPYRKFSGMLCSDQIGYSIGFDEKSLKIFCGKWEDDTGKSLDENFQCYLWPLPDDFIPEKNQGKAELLNVHVKDDFFIVGVFTNGCTRSCDIREFVYFDKKFEELLKDKFLLNGFEFNRDSIYWDNSLEISAKWLFIKGKNS